MSKAGAAILAAIITAAGGITAALISSHHGGTPSPPVSGSSYATGTIQVPAGDTDAFLYSVPTGDLLVDRVGEMSAGTNVQIICTVQGPAVANGDTLWDKVVYNSGSAYISDYYLYTGSDQAMMPSC